MESSLFKYIWRFSRPEQIALLTLVVASMPFYFLSLDLPKQIVNEGISGQGFSGPGSTQAVLKLYLPFGEFLTGAPVVLFDGIPVEQKTMLFFLCGAFLLLVIVNGTFKRIINTQKGKMGERMLRRLRFELTDRVLRFPLPQLRRVKPAEVASMINAEVEPIGGFIGDAFVQPVLLGGQALTAMIFIMVQNFWLGSLAMAIVLVQAFLIPRLRAPILRLGRQRQLASRQFAGRLGEIVDGSAEIHSNDTSNFERADFSSRLGKIFTIRFEIYQRKFFVKFLNNLLAQITPFFFYSIGGYLAITGRLDLGALFAVIAAYKDLPSPIKELIDWDQQRNDVQIKYEQVIDQFHPDGLMPPERQALSKEIGPPLEGELSANYVALSDDTGGQMLQGVTFSVPTDQHVAIAGTGRSGKGFLAEVLAGLMAPSGGSLSVGGRDFAELSEATLGRRIGYVGPEAYLFPVSVRENLVYGLKHAPQGEPEDNEEWRSFRWEATRSGNPVLDISSDWIDYAGAGVADDRELQARLRELLGVVDIEDDIYRLGLGGTIDPGDRPDVAEGILKARNAVRERLAGEAYASLVEQFDFDAYNHNSTVAENILFGTPVGPTFEIEHLADNSYLMSILADEGLDDKLLAMGISIAETMVELFADLPPGHPFFDQFSFIAADDLPDYQMLVNRAGKGGRNQIDAADRRRLLTLPFRYIEARHRLDLVDDAFETLVLSARRRFGAGLPEEYRPSVAFYEVGSYNASASLQDNLLFGRIVHGQAQAEDRVGALLREVLESLGLRRAVLDVGLDFNVGLGGRRMTAAQRQKVALARALLKQPDLLIVNGATSSLDRTSHVAIMDRVLELRRGKGLIWALHLTGDAEKFDYILVMDDGRLVEKGVFAELGDSNTAFGRLLAAD